MTHANCTAPHRARPFGRPGVTLIEILVVIAIIGILMALTAVALQKTTEGQTVRSSTDQVFKLQQALDQEYELVVNKCAQDASRGGIPSDVVNWCDGDMARAKAVWTAGHLRLHFPETFAEASLPVPLSPSYSVPPLAVFRTEIPAGLAGGTYPKPHDESAALLYIILAKKSVRGGGAMAISADDLTQAMRKKVTFTNGGTTKELEVFADAWKESVGFHRWFQGDEVQETPYVDGTKAKSRETATVKYNRDPLDPQSLVAGWSDSTKRNLLAGGLLFNAQNRMANVYSVGKNKQLDGGAADDIFGFRLRKPGSKGGATQ